MAIVLSSKAKEFNLYAPSAKKVYLAGSFNNWNIKKTAAHGTSIADRWALSLILGGAIGNWIDRLRFEAVIDFIDFRIWPVFNIADTAITIGVCLYFIRVLMSKEKT